MDEDGITMTARDNIPPAIASRVPLEVSDVIGTLPVLESEEPSLYWQMFQNLAVPLEPEDVHEWMLVKTIADCDWQAVRYERIKSRIIDLRFKEALINILRSILEEDTIKHSREQDARELAEDWFTDPKTKRAILRHLFDYGLSGGPLSRKPPASACRTSPASSAWRRALNVAAASLIASWRCGVKANGSVVWLKATLRPKRFH